MFPNPPLDPLLIFLVTLQTYLARHEVIIVCLIKGFSRALRQVLPRLLCVISGTLASLSYSILRNAAAHVLINNVIEGVFIICGKERILFKCERDSCS